MIKFDYKTKHRLQKIYTKIAFFAVGKVFCLLSFFDKEINREIKKFNEGFTIVITFQNGFNLTLQKRGNVLKLTKGSPNKADLQVIFKNLYSAFLVFSLQSSFEQSVADHRVSTKGDITHGMALIRCFAKVLSYIPTKRG